MTFPPLSSGLPLLSLFPSPAHWWPHSTWHWVNRIQKIATFSSSHHWIYPPNCTCNCCHFPLYNGQCPFFCRRRYSYHTLIPSRFYIVLLPLKLEFFSYPFSLLHYQHLPLFWVFYINNQSCPMTAIQKTKQWPPHPWLYILLQLPSMSLSFTANFLERFIC